MSRWWVIAAVGWGCAHAGAPAAPMPAAPIGAPLEGEVRVVPALQLNPRIAPDYSSYVTRLSPSQEALRQKRAHQLDELASEVGVALPGEVNGEVGESWAAQFRSWRYPPGARQRLVSAIRSGQDLDRTLGQTARSIGGDAVLFTWLDELHAIPLTKLGPLGTLADTPVGPVVLDAVDEPYRVSARVGAALVTGDGRVIVRSADTFATVLSSSRGPSTAARDLAHSLAAEVARSLAVDPAMTTAVPPTRTGLALAPAPAHARLPVHADSLR